MKKCIYCAEEIQPEATLCKHCGNSALPDNCEFCDTSYNRNHSAYKDYPGWRGYPHSLKYEYGILFFKKKYEVCDYCSRYLEDEKKLDWGVIRDLKNKPYPNSDINLLTWKWAKVFKELYSNKDEYSQKIRDFISSRIQEDKEYSQKIIREDKERAEKLSKAKEIVNKKYPKLQKDSKEYRDLILLLSGFCDFD